MWLLRLLSSVRRDARLKRKVCVYCGFSGRVIQRATTRSVFGCPSCGGDLYARPPKSYREMEGLDEPKDSCGPRLAGAWSGALQLLGLIKRPGPAWIAPTKTSDPAPAQPRAPVQRSEPV